MKIRIKSQSDPKKVYIATWMPQSKRWSCTCPAFAYSRTGGPCKHVRDLPPPSQKELRRTDDNKPHIGRRNPKHHDKFFTNIYNQVDHDELAKLKDRPPNPVTKRARNPQREKGYKRVGKYMTPPTSRNPKFIKGKKGRFGVLCHMSND